MLVLFSFDDAIYLSLCVGEAIPCGDLFLLFQSVLRLLYSLYFPHLCIALLTTHNDVTEYI